MRPSPTPLPVLLVLPCLLTSLSYAAESHPSLLLTPASLAQLKDRIQSAPFKTAYANLKSRVDASLNDPVDLPPRGSNWYHWYVCPKHGNRLATGKQLAPWQWQHICPIDQQILLGDPAKVETDYDGCRIQTAHSDLAALVRDAGLLFQLTNDKRYLEKAREILLAYANKYADYPLHTTRREPKLGGGRVGSQTLDESTFLIPLTQGADLVWPDLTPQDRATITTKLLLPAAKEVILPHKMGVHNIQCWKNSAVGLVGLLLDDTNLIASAIDDPASGFRTQIRKGVQNDGPWWENAWGYHFYTLSALWPLAEAARNHGIDLYDPRYKLMFDAPINFAMPNVVLPDFNDSGQVSLRARPDLYELAYARYKDPRYLPLLATSDRQNNFSLYFGVPQLPPAPTRSPLSANYPDSGYAILTQTLADQPTWLSLKYGPHGGGHGHPDKLNFILYARSQVLAPDAGITSYGSPLHSSWFRKTIAHNTLTIDQQDQNPATGKCIAFGSLQAPSIDYLIADAGPIHDNLRFTRTIALIDPNLILFIDQIQSPAPHTLDIAFHHRGSWDSLPTGSPFPPSTTPGYQHLADTSTRQVTDTTTLALRVSNNWKTTLTLAADPQPTTLITATAPGSSTADRVPVALFRRNAANTAFVYCLALDDQSPRLRMLTAKTTDGLDLPPAHAVALQLTSKSRTLYLLANPDKRPLSITLPDKTQWPSAAPFDVR